MSRLQADAFLRACALEPNHAQHRISAANMLLKLGDAEAALAQYRLAEALPDLSDKLAQYITAKQLEARKLLEGGSAQAPKLKRGGTAKRLGVPPRGPNPALPLALPPSGL